MLSRIFVKMSYTVVYSKYDYIESRRLQIIYICILTVFIYRYENSIFRLMIRGRRSMCQSSHFQRENPRLGLYLPIVRSRGSQAH